MPRRREVQLLLEVEHNSPVSDHLKKEYWRLKALAKEALGECPVCTDAFECQKCTLLLSCGHQICVSCYLRLREPLRCPLCRR